MSQSLRWLALLLTPLLGSCMTSTFLPLPHDVKREKDVRYTPERWPKPMLADVYYRPSKQACPAVLLIHGGSWKASDDRWTMTPIAKALVRRGYVVVNAGYRGTPGDRHPAPLEDLHEAIRWMRANSQRYGIDPEKIATYGFSAGAHLAAQLALADGNPSRVRAIVTAAAPFDLYRDPGGDEEALFLGGSRDQIPKVFREASPIHHVTRSSPPIFIYQGSKDTVVPPDHARWMAEEYRKNGFDTQVHWVEGRGHSGIIVFPGDAVDRAIDFLDHTLK